MVAPAASASFARTPLHASSSYLEAGKRRQPTIRHAAPSRIEGETQGPPLSNNVVLLIQEWLRIAKLPATLHCFVDEYTRVQRQPPPGLDEWYEMTQALDLPTITLLELVNPALLEHIVAQAFARYRRRQEATATKPPTTVLVTKRPATAAPTLKFASKRSLPVAGSTSLAESRSTPALPSPSRPQSAVVVAVSRSTPALLASESHGPTNSNRTDQSPAKKSTKVVSPPKSRPSSGHTESPKRSDSANHLVASQSSRSLLSSSRQDAESRKQSVNNSNSAAPAPEAAGDDARPEVDDAKPTVELEDMTEEHLAEHFRALSRTNIKKLRRVLAKSSAHAQELQRTRLAMDKIQLKAQQKHEQSAFAAKQTELLSTTMDMLIKEPCSLCRHVFLKKNLTTKVSYKSICDLRASWAAKHRQERHTVSTAGADPASHETQLSETEADDAVEQTTALETTQQISHLYDEVPVCVFCAQLALNFSSYRPTSAEQKERKEAKHRLALEKQKQRELQRQRDRLKCDPLNYHSYELNSDEDDDDVEMSEVLEVDGDGRVQVVRRRRYRRRTVRPAVATSLVSKRIHYENMRSQSIHALNRQEWEIISQCQHDL